MKTMNQCIAALQTGESSERTAAAEALAGLGAGARPAIVALVEGCGADDEELCHWCQAALEQVGAPTPAQIPVLLDLARAAHSDVAFWAVTLLGRARATVAVPILTARTQDASAPQVQRRAAWALQQIRAAHLHRPARD